MVATLAKSLRDNGLLKVRHPHMVDRYNSALEIITGHRTAFSEFQIDATGFSPEIAEELGDPDYLNPLGTNRKYILITLSQKDLPVLDPRFSSTGTMMRDFIARNEEALFLLTSRDAVWGEMEDATWRIRSIEDLLSIKKIRFTVNTPTGILENAERLSEMVQEFTASKDMWRDDAVIEEMVELAKSVGDVRRHHAVPDRLEYRKDNYHTSHLGGLYVFSLPSGTVLLHEDPAFQTDITWQGKKIRCIPVSDTEAVINFLFDNDLIVLPRADTVVENQVELLRTLEFLAFDHISAQRPTEKLSGYDFNKTRSAIYAYHDEMPVAFHEIQRALKYCDAGLAWDADLIDASTLAYMAKTVPGANQALVEHLLAHLTPADYLGSYLHNRPLFFKRYETWNDARRDYTTAQLSKYLNGYGAGRKAKAIMDVVLGNGPGEAPGEAHDETPSGRRRGDTEAAYEDDPFGSTDADNPPARNHTPASGRRNKGPWG